MSTALNGEVASTQTNNGESDKLLSRSAKSLSLIFVLAELAGCVSQSTQPGSFAIPANPEEAAATPEPATVPEAVGETCAPDNFEYEPLGVADTPLLIIDPSTLPESEQTSQWNVVAGEFNRSKTTDTIYLVAISDTAAQQLIGNPQLQETLRILGASIQALGAKIAIGSQYSLISIPAAGYYIAITHPEVGQLQAQADCVGAQIIVKAIRQALGLSAPQSAFTECGYPPLSTPTPTHDDGRTNATLNQLEEGKIKLGLGNTPNHELTREQLIEALEAACPAGGIPERLYHLEGRDRFTAQNLQAQGYTDRDIYFFIIHRVPLPW